MNYKLIIAFLCLIHLSACNSDINSSETPQKKYTDIKISGLEDYLIPVSKNEFPELGDSIGFVNRSGDTIIPLGKYSHCWTDTFKTFAIVYDKKNTNGETIAIDREEHILFDVVFFDNGPDYISDGLFRVKRNGKIGYANEIGQIVIPCQYQCAFPFEDGKAKVTYNCQIEGGGEHQVPHSTEWFYIDLNGKRTE